MLVDENSFKDNLKRKVSSDVQVLSAQFLMIMVQLIWVLLIQVQLVWFLLVQVQLLWFLLIQVWLVGSKYMCRPSSQ